MTKLTRKIQRRHSAIIQRCTVQTMPHRGKWTQK